MWVAVLGDTGGCCWVTSSRAALRAKDGGSTLTKRGRASSLLRRLETDEVGDSLDWLIDPLANIVYWWLGQWGSLQAKVVERACLWVTWRWSVGYRWLGS